MIAVIFAGGVGTRLWPLSRRSSPKQFEKVMGDKSTLQLAAERLLPEIPWENIYVATGERYVSIVKEQLQKIPTQNIIVEPEMRDVGPAVGLVLAHLMRKHADTPIVILWSDHIVRDIDLFKKILVTSSVIVKQKKDKIIFIGQKPRFASQNLGWIKYNNIISKVNSIDYYEFDKFHYRPDIDLANKFFKSGNYSWNVGYFVTTPSFLWQLYKNHQPEMYKVLEEIHHIIGTHLYNKTLHKQYITLPKISFDNAILEKISSKDAMVVSENLGWSDVGAWEALKEALQSSPDQNVIQGKVLVTDSKDCLIYNYNSQMVVTIDLNSYLVINTNDVLLICHKNSVPKIKKLVESMAGSENEHLI